jgi:hypothetical protein
MAKLWLEWNYDNNTASTKTGTKRTVDEALGCVYNFKRRDYQL